MFDTEYVVCYSSFLDSGGEKKRREERKKERKMSAVTSTENDTLK